MPKTIMEAEVDRTHKEYTRDYDDLIEFIVEQSKDVFPPYAHELVVAAGELLVNVFHYAYEPGTKGPVSVECEINRKKRLSQITIRDSGKPFDPAEWGTDTNIRVISCGSESKGIGILIAKRYLSDLKYERKDGWNVLTVLKSY